MGSDCPADLSEDAGDSQVQAGRLVMDICLV